MKVCPKCGQSFADGFTYCPKDAARLEKYDLRSRVQREDEFHFLLESESLITRLRRELVSAVGELRANPRAFLRGLLRGEGSTRRRKKLLQAGLATGLLAYASVFVAVSLIGLLKLSLSEQSVVAISDPDPLNEVTILLPTINTKTERAKNQAKSGAGSRGGSLSRPHRPSGGGGGNDQKRTSRGVPPIASLNQQLAQPDLELPVIAHSTLIIRPSVYADPDSLRRLKGPVGMLDSPPEAPSRGPGHGTGIGPGKGPGYGPGEGGNVGGRPVRIGGGPGGLGDGIPVMSANLKPIILHREKARYTEEARQNRVQGAVMLTVVFGADGRIHDIRTIRGLPHGLTETSIEAAQKILFRPATQNGKPVSVRATLEFNFALY